MVAMLLVALSGFAQRGRQRGNTPPRFSGPPPHASQQPQPPPPQQQQPSSEQEQQRPFDRFILHGPGPHAGDWLRSHENLSPADQKKALEADPGFQKLTPQGQQELIDRLNRFNSLPPDRRNRILQRMETLEHLTPQERQRARDMFRTFRELPAARRSQLNFALRDLHAMSPDDRQRTLDSNEYKARFSDQERDLLRGMSEMELVPNHPPRDEQ